ncbi:Bidirectional sugar transporter SWEET14, partial [Linum grandiflorum]
GNIVSFFVFLAPLPTFYRIVKEKSTQGFQSIPYSVALFSAMLYLYYASLKVDALMLITINSVGCLIESTYLIIFLIYAPKSVRMQTARLIMLFNLAVYGLIVILSSLFAPHPLRVHIVGWICAVFSVCVFAAPLTIIRLVIKTKSVEFMPFSLSLLLTLCAVFWLIYGLALDDYYIAVSFVTKQTLPSSFSGTILKVWLFWLQAPNILGFAFGLTQMGLYLIYRNKGKTEVLPAADNSTRSQPTTKLPTTTHDLLVSDEDKSKNVVISVTITKLEAEEEEEEEAAAKAKGKQYLGDQTLVDEPKKEERPTDLNV